MENVQYIVSPYEADAQMAYMVEKGQVDFAITEDSDLLAYGCKKVQHVVTLSNECQHCMVQVHLKVSYNKQY